MYNIIYIIKGWRSSGIEINYSMAVLKVQIFLKWHLINVYLKYIWKIC